MKQTTISREEALKQADDLLVTLLQNGDKESYRAANNDQATLVVSSMNAREKIADKIQRGEI